MQKNTFLKILLLFFLSLKVSVFVYNTIISIDIPVENSIAFDLEDSEGEEKEVDELKKIVQYYSRIKITTKNISNLSYNRLSIKYKSRILENSTPPPELI